MPDSVRAERILACVSSSTVMNSVVVSNFAVLVVAGAIAVLPIKILSTFSCHCGEAGSSLIFVSSLLAKNS